MKVTVHVRRERPNKAGELVSGHKSVRPAPPEPTQHAVRPRPHLHVDYAGGYDHALLELSDVLPAHLYKDALKKHL